VCVFPGSCDGSAAELSRLRRLELIYGGAAKFNDLAHDVCS